MRRQRQRQVDVDAGDRRSGQRRQRARHCQARRQRRLPGAVGRGARRPYPARGAGAGVHPRAGRRTGVAQHRGTDGGNRRCRRTGPAAGALWQAWRVGQPGRPRRPRRAPGPRQPRPRLRPRRHGSGHRHLLLRLADAHRACQAAAGGLRSAAARRAVQLPRLGGAAVAGAVPAHLPRWLPPGGARPHADGPHLRPGGGGLPRQAAHLRRHVHAVPGTARGGAGADGRRLRAAAGGDRAHGGVRAQVPRQLLQGAAGAEPRQATRPHGAPAAAAGAVAYRVRLPARAQGRTARAQRFRGAPVVRRPRGDPRPGPGVGPRRSARAGGRKRGRQVDPDARPGRRRAGRGRAGDARHRSDHRLLRAGSRRAAHRLRQRPGVHGGGGAHRHGAAGAQSPRRVPVQRRRGVQAAVRAQRRRA